MARIDCGIEEARITMERKNECEKTVMIVAEYPEIDYVLAYRGGKYQPWVAAWAYNGKSSWGQGHYFEKLEDAIEFIRMKKGLPNWYRLDEIASKAIDGLFEDDPYEAEIYCEKTLELTDYEREYFGIEEKKEEESEW